MGINRVEAFSDGIITIMVLELKVPAATPEALFHELMPSLFVYALSFILIAIMWVNHHSYLRSAKRADAALLWSNNNLLFWMSLIPFVTAYMGRNPWAPFAVACYGGVLTLTCVAFVLLQRVLIGHNHGEAAADRYRHLQRKSAVTVLMYAASVGLAFVSVYISFAIYVLIPALYFLPDRVLSEPSE